MLEVNSPWDNKKIGLVKKNDSKHIEMILEETHNVSKNKGIDFPLKDRIIVLKKFQEMINKKIESLAELATSEGGKPISDSIIEIKRGSEGVESCIEILKSEAGSVIPMNINEASSNRIAFTQKGILPPEKPPTSIRSYFLTLFISILHKASSKISLSDTFLILRLLSLNSKIFSLKADSKLRPKQVVHG